MAVKTKSKQSIIENLPFKVVPVKWTDEQKLIADYIVNEDKEPITRYLSYPAYLPNYLHNDSLRMARIALGLSYEQVNEVNKYIHSLYSDYQEREF